MGHGFQSKITIGCWSKPFWFQVDDMDGYQDEGYEEAILPTDFVDGRDGDYSVICTNDLHDVPGLDFKHDSKNAEQFRGWLNQ